MRTKACEQKFVAYGGYRNINALTSNISLLEVNNAHSLENKPFLFAGFDISYSCICLEVYPET